MFAWKGYETNDVNETLNQTRLYRSGAICHSSQCAHFSCSTVRGEMLFHLQPYGKGSWLKIMEENH